VSEILPVNHAARYYFRVDLESLRGDRAESWSIRINDQFRLCFRWTGTDAEDVEIVDYH
jgi:plasmid maintenance system killer protein